MIPNKIGKPLSWYNELDSKEQIVLVGTGDVTKEQSFDEQKSSPFSLKDLENADEPDMRGIEENV